MPSQHCGRNGQDTYILYDFAKQAQACVIAGCCGGGGPRATLSGTRFGRAGEVTLRNVHPAMFLACLLSCGMAHDLAGFGPSAVGAVGVYVWLRPPDKPN